MSYLSNNVYDSGLDYLTTNGSRVDICDTEPATYAEATSTYTLGNDTVTVGAAGARSGGGREVEVSAVSGGSVTGTDTAGFWALTDGSSELLAAGALDATQSVTSGNTFDLAAFNIGIPAPA